MTKAFLTGLLVLGLAAMGFVAAVQLAAPRMKAEATPTIQTQARPMGGNGDHELAYLLVKLELKTRGVIAEHFTRSQSAVPGVNETYQRWLTKNHILPAAVADKIFSEVVPHATAGRAWVKMVVPEPRNPHNRADATALGMFEQLRSGAKTAERSTPDAYYYGEPIVAKEWCLRCHGDPKGAPDPSFPQFKKDGWRAGDIIGGVIARVASKL